MDDHTVDALGDDGVRDIRAAMQRQLLFFDGGTGSLLQQQGLRPPERSETWNVSHPEAIIAVHYGYYLAGANIITTNTFGANGLSYPPLASGAADSGLTVERVVKAGVACANEARRRIERDPLPQAADARSSSRPPIPEGISPAARPHFIALDLGPTGKLLEPFGDLGFEEAVALYARVVRAGCDGVDAIIIETMGDSYETKAAVMAAKENACLPIFVTNVYSETGRLLTGGDVKAMVALLEGLGVDAYGMNCGLGPLQMERAAPTLIEVSSRPVILNPNAGLPHTEGGAALYDIDPDEFAASVARLVGDGANLVGGCCGTTPAYICELVNLCQGLRPTPVTDKGLALVSSGTHAVQLGGGMLRVPPAPGDSEALSPAAVDRTDQDIEPVVIGCRIDPEGNPEVAQALLDGDIDRLVDEALDQRDDGVDVLAVDVGLPGVDEPAVMVEVLEAIREVCDLPLLIETGSLDALEAALRICNGKPLVRFGDAGYDAVVAALPLVRRYGGVVVAVAPDGEGASLAVAPDGEGASLAVAPDGEGASLAADAPGTFAERVYAEAVRLGVERKDIVFDAPHGRVASR